MKKINHILLFTTLVIILISAASATEVLSNKTDNTPVTPVVHDTKLYHKKIL